MQIHFQVPDTWHDLNEAMARELQLNRTAAQVFKGLSHALMESTQGLARQFPHKKKLIYFKNMSPFFEPAVTALAREGVAAQALDYNSFVKDPSQLKPLLDNETLFVLWAADDPLLGRCFADDKIVEQLAGSRTVLVRLFHCSHWAAGYTFEKDKFMLDILSITDELSLVLMGERARMNALMAEGMLWNFTQVMAELEAWRQTCVAPTRPGPSQQQLIQEFEASNPGGGQDLLAHIPRCYDRAVLCWEDMDGAAFIAELSERLGFQLDSPGREKRLETTSLSRWGGVKTMEWLLSQGYSLEQVRGMVLLSADLVALGAELTKHIEASRQEILRLQNSVVSS